MIALMSHAFHSGQYYDKYSKSVGHSALLNYTGGSFSRAKLSLIKIPTVRSRVAFHTRGSRDGFIRLGLNDIEVRTINQKVSFRSGYSILNKHPGYHHGGELMTVDELLHKLGF